MKYARLFREHEPPILVSAEDVKNGLYSRYEEFVDPEYEFKVQFVKGARNNGGPYFRMYYSYEEYKQLFPERASRYEIVANMRRHEESPWHKKWKFNVSSFCATEKYIENTSTKKYRFADAYYDKTKTCIEFQHSYISFDFEERNAFYCDLSINTIWLYDLSSATTHQDKQGYIEILEDNAKGFFRISEKPENLKNHCVYIQVKSKKIYRVSKLLRRFSSGDKRSTIRYFIPEEDYSESEFIDAIRLNRMPSSSFDIKNVADTKETQENIPKPLSELWDSHYSSMIVKNAETNEEIFINRGPNDEIFRDSKTGCIVYQYANSKTHKEYRLSHTNEKRPIWTIVHRKRK